MTNSDPPLYDDGLVLVDDGGVTLWHYYFPTFSAKRIDFEQIRSVRPQPMGWWTGKGRIWGTASWNYWLPLDWRRPWKAELVVLDVRATVHPAFTPDDPATVVRLIDERTAR